MKKIKRILSSLLALVMVLSLSVPAFAAGKTTNSVTLVKMLLTEDNLNSPNFPGTGGVDGKQPYTGDQITELEKYFGTGSKPIAGVYFAWQYEVSEGKWQYIKGTSDGATLDAGGKVQTADNVDDAFGGITGDKGYKFNTANLPDGDYRIVEVPDKSTYVGENGETLTGKKAVPVEITLPLVNENGVVEDAYVYPKNSEDKPQIDKNFSDPGADYSKYDANKGTHSKNVGDTLNYQVKTQIPQNAKYKTLRWQDTMTKGLTFNKDVEIEVKRGTDTITFGPENYVLEQNDSGFTLKVNDDGIKLLEAEAEKGALDINITYSAIVNSSAVVNVADKNEVQLEYSNKPNDFVEPRETTTKPKDQKITVNKNWATDGGAAPAGIEVTYFLFEKGATAADDKLVDSVIKSTGADGTGDLSHTFKGLDADKEYYVKESVRGYKPAYTKGTEDGTITVTNTRTPGTPLVPTTPKIVTYGKKFVKTGNVSTDRLAGATFIVRDGKGDDAKYLALADVDKTAYNDAQTAYEKAITAYNGAVANEQTSVVIGTEEFTLDQAKAKINDLANARDEAFNNIRAYKWTDNKDEAIKFISNAKGQLEITGLAEGKYYLQETKAPEGYAILKDRVEFDVNADSYDKTGNITYEPDQPAGTANDAQEIQNKKVTIPQTGGMGTLLFVIIGLCLMGTAVYAMKKRNSKEEIA